MHSTPTLLIYLAKFSRKACQVGGQRSGAARYAKLQDKRARAIQMGKEGASCRQIAKALGVGKSTVNDWLRGVRCTARNGPRRRVSGEVQYKHVRVKGKNCARSPSASPDTPTEKPDQTKVDREIPRLASRRVSQAARPAIELGQDKKPCSIGEESRGEGAEQLTFLDALGYSDGYGYGAS